jgi:hypothetical protein
MGHAAGERGMTLLISGRSSLLRGNFFQVTLL